jgi:DNA polymerase-3 subunit delta
MTEPTGSPSRAAIGYYWGDDGYGLEDAAAKIADRLAAEGGGPVERSRLVGAETTADRIGERVATSTMFGGGSLVLVSDPYFLIRAREARERLIAVLGQVAPGNGLVFLDSMERLPKALDSARTALVEAVKANGGDARPFAAPNGPLLERWIETRARERGIRLARGVAQEITRRVGGQVREGDVDRRRQTQIIAGELEKLALLHPDGTEVSVDDVRALVPEAIPGSAFAFLDALGHRRLRETTEQLERLFDTTPEPVILAQLYSRVRQLLEVGDRLADGQGPRELSSTMKMHPYVLEKLVRQAHAWSVDELVAALDGLLDLDVMVKSADRTGSSEPGRRLAFALWIDEHVGGRYDGPRPGIRTGGPLAARR